MGFGGGGGGSSSAAITGPSQGTAAGKPASPSFPGQLYFATDTQELWIGNAAGNAWQFIAQTSSAVYSIAGGGGQVNLSSGSTALRNNGTLVEAVVGSNFRVAAAGHGYSVTEGSNAKQGTAVLVAGTVTVSNTSVTANSRIFTAGNLLGGTAGGVNSPSRTPGTSFTLTSTNAADTSTVAYVMNEQ